MKRQADVVMVGMRYYGYEHFKRSLIKVITKREAVLAVLARDPDFENGVRVYFHDGSHDGVKSFTRVGTIATNTFFMKDPNNIVNGADIAKLLDNNQPYVVAIAPKEFRVGDIEDKNFEEIGSKQLVSIYPISFKGSDLRVLYDDQIRLLRHGQETINFNKGEELEKMKEIEAKGFPEPPYIMENGGQTFVIEPAGRFEVKFHAEQAVQIEGEFTVSRTLGMPLKELEARFGKYNDTMENQTIKKGDKKMKNMNSMFSKFGKDFAYPTSNFAMPMFGGLAVKQGTSYVTYDMKKNESTDVMDFVMDGFSDMIMILPSQELKVGDIFIQDGKVYHKIEDDKAYSYTDNTVETLVNKSNIMGFKMYAKVFNMMANFGVATGEGKEQNMFANPMFMMMMMKDGESDMSDMMQMMMMSQMFQSGGLKF